jgi:hypothetical protein
MKPLFTLEELAELEAFDAEIDNEIIVDRKLSSELDREAAGNGVDPAIIRSRERQRAYRARKKTAASG